QGAGLPRRRGWARGEPNRPYAALSEVRTHCSRRNPNPVPAAGGRDLSVEQRVGEGGLPHRWSGRTLEYRPHDPASGLLRVLPYDLAHHFPALAPEVAQLAVVLPVRAFLDPVLPLLIMHRTSLSMTCVRHDVSTAVSLPGMTGAGTPKLHDVLT